MRRSRSASVEKLPTDSPSTWLARRAWQRAAARRTESRVSTLRGKSLGPFIPEVTPGYGEPKHLHGLLVALEALLGGARRLCLSVPPRHGKSDTLLHYVAWLLLNRPTTRILYVTHTATFARKQGRTARKLAKAAGVKLSSDAKAALEWETVEGGGLVSRGWDGEVTGRGFDIVIVDDPIKSRKIAESSLLREAMFDTFTSDIFTRLTPTGSVLVVHTRWHVDDLIGRLVKEKGFDRLNLRAVAENDNDPANDNRKEGEALWPDGGWTAEVLADRRRTIGEYAWWSLYQGEPRPRGGTLFGDPHWYQALPTEAYRVGIGVDLAYSAKTAGRDYSVLLELWRKGNVYYVVSVARRQCQAPEFVDVLKRKARDRKGVRFRWDASGTEKGVAQFFRKAGLPVDVRQPIGDPFVRAQDVAAAWNAGRVLLPDPEKFQDPETGDWLDGFEWVDAFLDELRDFTGLKDKHDDQVVSLASAFAQLQKGRMLTALENSLAPKQT